MRPLLALLLLVLSPHGLAAADPGALARSSLPFLRAEGLAWIENRQCASCHQIPSMLWSFNSAHRAGDPDASRLVEAWTEWAADWRHWNKTGDQEGIDRVAAGNVDTMAFLLLSRSGLSTPALDWQRDFHQRLLTLQEEDGSWQPGGQLPLGKRPARETREVTTMWTLLALQSPPAAAVPATTLQRARDFLAKAEPGRSTEWHALRLLLAPTEADLREALLQHQHPEGGWGWLTSEPADAFGTGLALLALTRSGQTPADAPVQRALAYLERTRQPTGSWPVPSTRARDKNKITRTATYWGTAWATIALLELSLAQTPPPPRSAP